jgi:hypothetical protein
MPYLNINITDPFNVKINIVLKKNTMSYRYLGNKARIADWIVDAVTNILPQNSKIADPMCELISSERQLAIKTSKIYPKS